MSDKPRPVILDTDIGDDIDDTWALAMLLNSPELDLRLVTTCTEDTRYRAQIVAKMLEIAGRTDVSIGLGPQTPQDLQHGRQEEWVADYPLERYPGEVREDGVQALIDTVMACEEPPTIIAIGPLTNLAAALRRKMEIAHKARFVGMQGSVYRGYEGSSKPVAEYNVVQDVAAAQAVFVAPWEMTITPLDTCGVVVLTDGDYQTVAASADPLARAVIENYQIWSGRTDLERSSVLFDTVAVYLAFSEELVTLAPRGIRVTPEGFTVAELGAKRVRCALEWRDLPAFERLVVERIVGG
jgi:inosine-uridine nucleoside N-ribohydrolase